MEVVRRVSVHQVIPELSGLDAALLILGILPRSRELVTHEMVERTLTKAMSDFYSFEEQNRSSEARDVLERVQTTLELMLTYIRGYFLNDRGVHREGLESLLQQFIVGFPTEETREIVSILRGSMGSDRQIHRRGQVMESCTRVDEFKGDMKHLAQTMKGSPAAKVDLISDRLYQLCEYIYSAVQAGVVDRVKAIVSRTIHKIPSLPSRASALDRALFASTLAIESSSAGTFKSSIPGALMKQIRENVTMLFTEAYDTARANLIRIGRQLE